jgi:Tfp pilus assembly protein PilN
MKIINLLPKHKQEELRYESLFHSVLIASGIAVAILLLGLLVQLGLRFYLNHQTSAIQKDIEQIKQVTNKQENNEIRIKIRTINAQMNDFKSLSASTPTWSKVLLAFAARVPDTVKINSFVADAATKKVTIIGQSPTREQVIQLHNNISADKENFKDIDYPLENIAKATDVTFHFTFYIQDQLLVNK